MDLPLRSSRHPPPTRRPGPLGHRSRHHPDPAHLRRAHRHQAAQPLMAADPASGRVRPAAYLVSRIGRAKELRSTDAFRDGGGTCWINMRLRGLFVRRWQRGSREPRGHLVSRKCFKRAV